MEKKLVVNNACLKCSAGSTKSNLVVPPNGVKVGGETVATENEATPLVNIQNFGFCSIKPGPCTPVTAKWINPITSVVIQGQPVISDQSTLPCAVGGIITVDSIEQETVYNKGSGSSSI